MFPVRFLNDAAIGGGFFMLNVFEQAVLDAGRAILDVYSAGPDVRIKVDASPVTEADHRAEAIILERLAAHYPDIPVVAEESAAAGVLPDIEGSEFFLVDPLDGTKEFIARNGEFTVNIALIRDGAPVAGIVYAPACGVAYSGNGEGAEKLTVEDFRIVARRPIHARLPDSPVVAVASASHRSGDVEVYLDAQGISSCLYSGSSLKFCLLAEGSADIYPRFNRTMEWDTAAGDAVLRAAGGMTLGSEHEPLRYGKTGENGERFVNPHFIAFGRRK